MVVEAGITPRHPIEDVAYAGRAESQEWLALGAWLPLTIGAALEQAAEDHGSMIAVADPSERLSYQELDARSLAVAKNLLAIGLRPSDRVLMQVGIGTTAVVALMGVFRAGLIPVCAVPRYRGYEMGTLAELSGARGHIVEVGSAGSYDLLASARGLRESNASVRHLIVAGAPGEGDAITLEPTGRLNEETGVQLSPPAPLDVAAFQLSGGTTGAPKVIPRFHAEYLGYAAAWAERIQLSANDVVLWSLPVTHNAGLLCFVLPSLLRRATLVLVPRFEVASFLATVERERVTVTGSIGPIAPKLVDYERADRFDLSSLRLFVTLSRAGDLEAHLGTTALNIFGITEGLLMASLPDSPPQARHMTLGYPASPHDEVRVLALGGSRGVRRGEVGELCFRGPSVLRGYYRDTAATKAAFTPDGLFRTGDLVRSHWIERMQYLSFEGRAKDNIDRGGEKFGTEEIETFLNGHPSIRESCVVGMPDRYLGERVCAFIIPRAGREAPGVEEVGRFLLGKGLAKFKLPERIEQLSDLPVTRVGKLDRPELRRRIADILTAEESQ